MRIIRDTFNLSEGYERQKIILISAKRRTFGLERMLHNGRVMWSEWVYRIDTRESAYPSFAAVAGAAEISFQGRRFWPVFIGFVRGCLKP